MDFSYGKEMYFSCVVDDGATQSLNAREALQPYERKTCKKLEIVFKIGPRTSIAARRTRYAFLLETRHVNRMAAGEFQEGVGWVGP